MTKEPKQSIFSTEPQEGNIWGWKFSLIGLALIVLLGGLAAYRHVSLGVPFGEMTIPSPMEATE